MPKRTYTRVADVDLERELDRLVHQGHLRSYHVKKGSGLRRRITLVWTSGRVQEAEVRETMNIIRALATQEDDL